MKELPIIGVGGGVAPFSTASSAAGIPNLDVVGFDFFAQGTISDPSPLTAGVFVLDTSFLGNYVAYEDDLEQMQADILDGVDSPVVVPRAIREKAAELAERWNEQKN